MTLRILKNYQLTKKALDYIYKNRRSDFDEMINELIEQKKNIYKEGGIKGKRTNTRRKKR
jgi:hypothetical protein